MSTSRQFNTPISLSSAALTATHNSNTIGNIFTTGGNVGIGTTNPSSILHLLTSSDTILNMTCSTGGHNTFIFNSPSTSRYADLYFSPNETINFRQRSGGSYPSRLFINTSGNVGIGTTTPTYTLDVNGTLEASNSNGLMLFASSGNVLIGSTTPTGSAFGNGNLYMYGANGSNNGIAINGVGNSTLQFWNSGTMKGAVVSVATAGNWSTDSRVGDMVIRCASSQSMLFNSNGGSGVATMVISGGNVGIGTTAPSSTLHVNGDIVSSNALILYSITPFYVEAQWTAFIESTINISSNIPSGAKAVLADVYLTNSTSDHVIITLGSEHVGNVTLWGAARGSQPSTQFTASTHTKRVNRYVIYGESDNFSSFFGLWYQSQTIYISQDRRIYWGNPGYSTGSGWLYINIKGYFL